MKHASAVRRRKDFGFVLLIGLFSACAESTGPSAPMNPRPGNRFEIRITGSVTPWPDWDKTLGRYGNWCGPNWSGGLEGDFGPLDPATMLEPVDLLDTFCRQHDLAYDRANQRWGELFLAATTNAERTNICKGWSAEFDQADVALSTAADFHIPLSYPYRADAPDEWGYDPRLWGEIEWSPTEREAYRNIVVLGFKKFSGFTLFSVPECKYAVSSVEVIPSSLTMETGSQAQFAAKVTGKLVVKSVLTTKTLRYREVSWSGTFGSPVTIDENGLVTAEAEGIALISAAVEKKFGIATITVIAPTPPQPRLVTGIGSIPELLRYSDGFLYFTQGSGALDRYIGGITADGNTNRAGGLVGGVAAMVTVRDSVYWVSDYFSDQGVRKNTLLQGTSQSVSTLASNLALLPYKADCFTSDGTWLFYIAEVGPGQYAIQKSSLDGRVNQSLAPISGQGACAVSGSDIFFADRGLGEIRRVPIDGSASSSLIADQIQFDIEPGRLFMYQGFIILTEIDRVRTVTIADGTVTTRAGGFTSYDPAVLNGSTLYINRRVAGQFPDFIATGDCLRLSLTNWTTSVKGNVGCTAVDNGNLYWWDRSPPDNGGFRGWWLLTVPK